MWFKLTNKIDPRFPLHWELNSCWLHTDLGWRQYYTSEAKVTIKGYCFEYSNDELAPLVARDPTPRYTGSFVAIIDYHDGRTAITNDTTRACPVFRNATELGNIDVVGNNVWSDAWVSIDRTMQEHRWPAVPVATSGRRFEDVVDAIDRRLISKFEWLRSQPPVKIFYSGGIDTLTCLAYLRSLRIPHELVPGEHFDYDQFTLEFESQLKTYWGYSQMHHWRSPTMLVTGACGDEYFMRGPATVNIMLQHLGLTMQDVLSDSDYHWQYFQGIEKSAMYQQQAQDADIQQCIKTREATTDYILRMCINDHQHWHLGNTLAFTPFKDIEILRTVLSLDDAGLVPAMTNATIQKELIDRHAPELRSYLAVQKNQDRTGIYRLADELY